MSINKTTYIGPYLKVFLPMVKEQDTIGHCATCGYRSSDKFCSKCGGNIAFGVIETATDRWDLGLDEEENFFWLLNNNNTFYYLIPNKRGMGGFCVDDEEEAEIPKNGMSHEAWGAMSATLDNLEIKYEKNFGIVQYWN